MKYARVIDKIVQEVFTPPSGFTIEDCFTPEVASQFKPCPKEVEVGWIKNADGRFTAPAEPPTPEPDTSVQPTE